MKKWLLSGVFLAGSSVADAQIILESPADHCRAGNPTVVKRLAQPSSTPRNIGYYVGGGALSRRKGDGPTVEEGTWGWDYQGAVVRRRVDLLWWHGRRYQGGSGAYRTDGPHLPQLHEAEGNHAEPHHTESNHGETGHGNGHE